MLFRSRSKSPAARSAPSPEPAPATYEPPRSPVPAAPTITSAPQPDYQNPYQAPPSPGSLSPHPGPPPQSHTPPPQTQYPYPYPPQQYYQQPGWYPPPQGYPGAPQWYPQPQGYPPQQGYPPSQGYLQPGPSGEYVAPPAGTVPPLLVPVGGPPSSSGSAPPSPSQPGQPQQAPSPINYPPQGYPPIAYPPVQYAELPASTPPTGYPGSPPPPALPLTFSPGYNNDISTGYNATTNAGIIEKALNDSLDLSPLIKILPRRSPGQILAIREKLSRHPTQLVNETVTSSTLRDASHIRMGLLALLLGPLDYDVYLLNQNLRSQNSLKYAWQLQLILLDRTPGDIAAIKQRYAEEYGRGALMADLREALKSAAKTRDPIVHLYQNILEYDRRPGLTEVAPEMKEATEKAIEEDVSQLRVAFTGTPEGNQFAYVFTTSTPARLREILQRFQKENGSMGLASLEKDIKHKFKEPFADALVYILRGVKDKGDGMERAKRDAEGLEGTMKGMGTKDQELLVRLVKASWDKKHLKLVKEMYKKHQRIEGLIARIRGETSRKWEEFLVAIAASDENGGTRPAS